MTLEPLIEAAYAAAHHPLRWEDFLDALLEHPGFGAAAVGYKPDVYDPFINGFLRGPEDAQIEAFFANAITDDPLTPLSAIAPLGAFSIHGNKVIEPEVFTRSGYSRWMVQNRFSDVLISGYRLEDDAMVLITLFCNPEANIKELRGLLRELAPHVCRALVLCQEYIELTRRYRQALAAIEHTRFGCALVGREGEIEWMNDRGRRLLEQAGWVQFEPSTSNNAPRRTARPKRRPRVTSMVTRCALSPCRRWGIPSVIKEARARCCLSPILTTSISRSTHTSRRSMA